MNHRDTEAQSKKRTSKNSPRSTVTHVCAGFAGLIVSQRVSHLPSIFLSPDLTSRNLLDAPGPETHVASIPRVECSLKQHILLVNLRLPFTHVVGDIYPQSVLGNSMLVIVLVQVDGVALKLQSHISNHAHNLAVVILRIGDELNEGDIE